MTFLFTDIEGSTRLLQHLGERYEDVLREHRRLLRAAFTDHGGHEVETQGDGFLVAFGEAVEAVAAARAGEQAIAGHSWPQGVDVRVRMGLHTGEPALTDLGYLGLDLHRAARICAAAHGGQVLVSKPTRDHVAEDELAPSLLDLGRHTLRDLPGAEHLFQLQMEGLPIGFPPPRAVAGPAGASGRERELAAAAAAAVGVENSRGRVLDRLLGRHRDVSIADVGWELRRALPDADAELREPIARLAAAVLGAARSAVDGDRYLADIDHKHPTRDLKRLRELAVLSRSAARELEALAAKVDILERLDEERRALGAEVKGLPEVVAAAPPPAAVDARRVGVEQRQRALDSALEDARRSGVRERFGKLRRTAHPGVHRLGDAWVVLEPGDYGVDKRHQYHTSDEAIARRESQRAEDVAAARQANLEREAARVGQYGAAGGASAGNAGGDGGDGGGGGDGG